MHNYEDYAEAFNKLQSYFILITIHDAQQYPIIQLKSLVHHLEKQLSLSPPLQHVYDQLTRKSDFNVAEKKRKKKEKKKQTIQDESTKDISLQDDSLNQSLSLLNFEQKLEVKQVCKGIIYDGRLFIKLKVSTDYSNNNASIGFFIHSHQKESEVLRSALEKKGIQVKYKKTDLWVEGRRETFRVKDEGDNILAYSFLKSHNVIINCNYRPESSFFLLKFTE